MMRPSSTARNSVSGASVRSTSNQNQRPPSSSARNPPPAPLSLSSRSPRTQASNSTRSPQRRHTIATGNTHQNDDDYLSEESPLSLNGMLRELADNGSSSGRPSQSHSTRTQQQGQSQRSGATAATASSMSRRKSSTPNNNPNVSDILPSKRQKREQLQQQNQAAGRNKQQNNNRNADLDYGEEDENPFLDDDDDDVDDDVLMDDSFQMKMIGGAMLQDRETQVDRLKQTLAAVQQQRDAYESESQSLARENGTLINTVEESHRQIGELQNVIKGLHNDKSHLLGERDSLNTKMRLLEAARDDDDKLLKERSQRAEQSLADVEGELKRARQEASSAQLALEEARSNFENEKHHISRTLTRLQQDVERLSGETSNRERMAEAEIVKGRESLQAANERISFLEETVQQQEDQIIKIENVARAAEDRESIARGEAAAASQASLERDELAEELTQMARRQSEAHQRWKEEREQIVAVNIRLQQESQQDSETIGAREREIHQLKRDVEDREDQIHSLTHELTEAQKTASEFQKNMSSLQFQHQKLAQRMMTSSKNNTNSYFDQLQKQQQQQKNSNNNTNTNDHSGINQSADTSGNELLVDNNHNNVNDDQQQQQQTVAAAPSSSSNNNSVALSLQTVCDNAVRRVHVAHGESMKLTQENASLRHQLTIANEERRAIEQLLQKKELEATELLRQRSDRVTELQERLAAEREACQITERERVSILEKYENVNDKLGHIELDEDKLRRLAVECEELQRLRGSLEADNTKYINQIARLEEQHRTTVAQREDLQRRLNTYKDSTSKSIKDCTSHAEKVMKETEQHFVQKLSSLEKQFGDRTIAFEDRRRLKERVSDLESQLSAAQSKLKTTSQRLASEISKKEEIMRHASETKVYDKQQQEEDNLHQLTEAKTLAVEELRKLHQKELTSLRKRVGESLRREVQKLHHQHNVDHRSQRAWMREAMAFFTEMDDISQVIARGAKAVDLDATSGGITEQIENTVAQTLKLMAAERENNRQPMDPHIKEQLYGRIDNRLRDDELKSRANDITRSFFGESSLRTLVDHQMETSPSRDAAAGNSEEAVAVLREQTVANQLSRSVNKIVMQFMQTVRSGLTNAPRVVDVVDSHRHTFNSMEKFGSIDARKEEIKSAVEDKENASSNNNRAASLSSLTTVGGQSSSNNNNNNNNNNAGASSLRARREADDITKKVFENVAEDDAGEMTQTEDEMEE